MGIVSDRDVRAFASVKDGFLSVPSLPVSDAMTRDLITCRPTATISEVGGKMLRSKIDCIPIVSEDGSLLGLVTSSDLIKLLIDREDSLSVRLPFELALRGAYVSSRRTSPWRSTRKRPSRTIFGSVRLRHAASRNGTQRYSSGYAWRIRVVIQG